MLEEYIKLEVQQKTHLKINQAINGTPIVLKEGYSKVALKTTNDMALDDTGLVHGGYSFGLADFAAMLAINHPNTVLGGAEVRFVSPIKTGEEIIAEALLINEGEKKQVVDVNIKSGDKIVFLGQFICFSPEKHVLE